MEAYYEDVVGDDPPQVDGGLVGMMATEADARAPDATATSEPALQTGEKAGAEAVSVSPDPVASAPRAIPLGVVRRLWRMVRGLGR